MTYRRRSSPQAICALSIALLLIATVNILARCLDPPCRDDVEKILWVSPSGRPVLSCPEHARINPAAVPIPKEKW